MVISSHALSPPPADELTAQEALELIELEYQDLETMVDPLGAVKPGAAVVHPD